MAATVSGTRTTNNAMMPTLVPPEKIGRLSGTGWATGYVGGILSLILVLGFLAANPETGRTLFGFMPLFGLDPVTHAGDRITGPLTGIWFILFVLPMFFAYGLLAHSHGRWGMRIAGGLVALIYLLIVVRLFKRKRS